eukprot:g1507.t1
MSVKPVKPPITMKVGGNSDQMLLLIGFIGLLIIGIAIYFLIAPSKKEKEEAEEAKKPRLTRAQRKAQIKETLRRRRAAQRANGRTANESKADTIDLDDLDVDDLEEVDESTFKGSKKKLRKMQRKQEKKERREYERHVREEKEQREKEKKTTSRYAMKIAAREEARLAREAAIEEEKKKEEEKAQKEFDDWKDMFEVDEAGEGDAAIEEESSGLLQEFIDYVKMRKVVVLEDVAAEFGIRSIEVVNRLNALQSMGRLTGVMDDRGKFIYITDDEMAKVAAFIKREGRISLSALAERSNEFIDLSPVEVLPEEEEEEEELKDGDSKKEEVEKKVDSPLQQEFEVEAVASGRGKGNKR